ncbi:MAG: alpha/beta fold hydrolase, partial [Burkholderiaceae bacterium]|nr:alpha/beta fold hydrolase [Burkholderiaceae bacterium]
MQSARSTVHVVQGSPRIAYEEAGKGEVVVFLHGIGGNRSNWAAQLERFGRDFRAVAWDTRGYGDSDDYEGAFDFADVSSDLCRLLDRLEVARAHLVGLSMGGRILMDFADRFPQRIASLTLAASFPSFGKALSPEQREEFVRLRLTPVQNGRSFADMAPALADALLGPQACDAARASVCASIGALRADSYAKVVRAAVDFDRTAVLPSIRARVLLLCGEHDRLVPPQM